MTPLDPASTYAHLGVDAEVTPIPLTPDFWPTIGERTELHTGRLMAVYEMKSDWEVWEQHPVGDEIVMPLDATMTFHLDDGESVTTQVVPGGHYVVIPAGTWHTADVPTACRMLGITWGEGTEHRPRT